MIQQTARAISLEMALRDMIAAGYKVQLSAEASDWFDDLYERMDREIITHETLGLGIEFLDSERRIQLGKGGDLDLVIRNHYQRDGFLLLTLYKDGVHIGTGTARIEESLFNPRVTHTIFKGRVHRALEGALGGTPC
mgnify:FL=1